MENKDHLIKVGMIAALQAVNKTLAMYPEGMSSDEVTDMINEIDQQLGLKEAEMILLNQ